MKFPKHIDAEKVFAACRKDAVFCAAHAQSAEEKAGDKEPHSEVLHHLDAAINAALNVVRCAEIARERYGLDKP